MSREDKFMRTSGTPLLVCGSRSSLAGNCPKLIVPTPCGLNRTRLCSAVKSQVHRKTPA